MSFFTDPFMYKPTTVLQWSFHLMHVRWLITFFCVCVYRCECWLTLLWINFISVHRKRETLGRTSQTAQQATQQQNVENRKRFNYYKKKLKQTRKTEVEKEAIRRLGLQSAKQPTEICSCTRKPPRARKQTQQK